MILNVIYIMLEYQLRMLTNKMNYVTVRTIRFLGFRTKIPGVLGNRN